MGYFKRNYPSLVVVENDSLDSFSVCVKEFSRSVDVSDLELYDGRILEMEVGLKCTKHPTCLQHLVKQPKVKRNCRKAKISLML